MKEGINGLCQSLENEAVYCCLKYELQMYVLIQGMSSIDGWVKKSKLQHCM